MNELHTFTVALADARTSLPASEMTDMLTWAYEALGYARGRIDAAQGGTPGPSEQAYLFAAAQVRDYAAGKGEAHVWAWERFTAVAMA